VYVELEPNCYEIYYYIQSTEEQQHHAALPFPRLPNGHVANNGQENSTSVNVRLPPKNGQAKLLA
jgi:hypothetical protein